MELEWGRAASGLYNAYLMNDTKKLKEAQLLA